MRHLIRVEAGLTITVAETRDGDVRVGVGPMLITLRPREVGYLIAALARTKAARTDREQRRSA